jgi:hypothetical protein
MFTEIKNQTRMINIYNECDRFLLVMGTGRIISINKENFSVTEETSFSKKYTN